MGDTLSCGSGCTIHIRSNIPRFVPGDEYAISFGLQWNLHRQTQLDSFSGTTISRDRLQRLLGGSLDAVHGATVLEAGCGAGRFTELLLAAGARVVAVDLSSAVEANRQNCGTSERYQVCQADIRSLPFAPEQFDIVVCVGVVQHTPSPEETIRALYSHVRPGGTLVLDHYDERYPVTLTRSVIRWSMLRLDSEKAWRLSSAVVKALWPVHRALFRASGGSRLLRIAYGMWQRLSPVVDYQAAYPELSPTQHVSWALLDTHDTLTDRYKHVRSRAQIAEVLAELGAAEAFVTESGNGVEARATKPVPPTRSS